MARRPYFRNSAIACAIVSTTSLAGSAFAQRAIDLDQMTMTKAAAELCAGKITSKDRDTLDALQATLESGGVEFIGSIGVQLKPDGQKRTVRAKRSVSN